MKLPWSREEEIEELKEKIQELEEEKQSLEERFEAEKERRSELARKKQNAEEEINRLRDKIRGFQPAEDEAEEEEDFELEELDFEKAYRFLRKLETAGSPAKDMTTVFSPGKIREIEGYKGLKNVITAEQLKMLQNKQSVAAFLDPDVFNVVLRTRPFFAPEWQISKDFSVSPMLDFIESEKTWVLVSAGETCIFTEKAGEYEKVETVTSWVNKQHSKGGYSQDRFERKREEQVQQHLEEVREVLQEHDNIYLLGQNDLCQDLPGEYLGGFDPNTRAPEVFYSFQLIR